MVLELLAVANEVWLICLFSYVTRVLQVLRTPGLDDGHSCLVHQRCVRLL
jgi:hypothetical protein